MQDFLDEGTLVRLGDTSMEAEGEFDVVVSTRAIEGASLDALTHWIIGQIGPVAKGGG